MSDEKSDFVDAPEIARMLGINRRTLRRMIVKGEFPPAELRLSTTLLRWKRETVASWIDAHLVH